MAENVARQITKREAGLAFARAWRIANKARFDALYGTAPCGCGGHG